MPTATSRIRAPNQEKHCTRVNVLARFDDRVAEARVQSRYLMIPFTYCKYER